MGRYIIRRLLLIIPTLFGIMLLNFIIIQAAPGGPVEQAIYELKYSGRKGGEAGGGQALTAAQTESLYKGAEGIDPALIKRLERIYGFDKPPVERFFIMMGRYLRFDFDKSFKYDRNIIELILERLPVSLSLGLWTTLLVYLISIPLGIRKAVRHGSRFDAWTSGIMAVFYAVPAFLMSLLLITLLASGNPLKLFPLRGLLSDNWRALPWYRLIVDYLWHIIIPVVSMVLSGFAGLTILTKNSFLEEINKQYVVTARAKGLTEKKILYRHVFRNAMLIVIARFPASVLAILFTGSLLIEVIFSLDGIGLLAFNAVGARDYPLIFGELYFLSLLGLLMKIVNDIMYAVVDPRIDFDSREV